VPEVRGPLPRRDFLRRAARIVGFPARLFASQPAPPCPSPRPPPPLYPLSRYIQSVDNPPMADGHRRVPVDCIASAAVTTSGSRLDAAPSITGTKTAPTSMLDPPCDIGLSRPQSLFFRCCVHSLWLSNEHSRVWRRAHAPAEGVAQAMAMRRRRNALTTNPSPARTVKRARICSCFQVAKGPPPSATRRPRRANLICFLLFFDLNL
jgi:hypothetical protein